MSYSNTSLKIINSSISECGFFKPIEFIRANDTNNKIVSSACWSYTQNRNIIKLKSNSELEILCTRCLSFVKKNFDFIKIYKIFQTTKDANNYNNKYFDEYEVIAIQENPSILTLVEDEILFEFSKIVNHEGCNLPESFFSKEISAFELDSKKNEKNNPFAKLKEKLHK